VSMQVVALLKEQNELLHKLYDSQVKLNKAQRHREWLIISIKLIPFILGFLVLLYLYFSVSSAVNDLAVQVRGVKDGIDSVFSLLTDQFESIHAQFSNIIGGMKGLVPNFGDMANSIKESFH